MAAIDDIEIPSLLFEEQADPPGTPASGLVRIYRDTDGNWYEVDDAGTVTEIGGGGGGGGTDVYHKRATRTSNAGGANDYTVSSTSWAALDATNLAFSIPASSGDGIEVSLSAHASAGDSVIAYFDVATFVSGSIVNHVSGGGGVTGRGLGTWMAAGSKDRIGGSSIYTLAAGDISGGNVDVRLVFRLASAGSRTIFCRTGIPLSFSVKNLGPTS